MTKETMKKRRLRVFALDRTTGRPISSLPILAVAEMKDGHQINLGILASDHAGFVSFDLGPLGGATDEIDHVWVYRLGDEASRVDARSATQLPDSGVLPILTEPLPLGPHIPRPQLPSIQGSEPDKCFVSPNSFFTNPSAQLGEDGCEILLPSNSATHEFRFRQVTRTIGERLVIRQPESDNPNTAGNTADEFWTLKTFSLPRGYVLEYKVTWYPLGHSLGRLLYSLPLAPCESVNLAVIDWSRRDEATRGEVLTVTEDLVHSQRRDRIIEETVKASLDEWQGGGSFMAGHSGAGSFDLGGFLSLGAADAMGGSYSSSGGERDLAATNVQKLSDNIVQTSRAVRSLRSTVVTQVSQQERESIQTRTVTNHNHCHAMTVLYYEVLRHYRVVTECVSKQKVVFVDYDVKRFDRKIAFCNRLILERVLLDPRLRGCFDAIERLLFCTPARLLQDGETAAGDAEPAIEKLIISVTTEDGTDGDVVFLLDLADGSIQTNDLGHTGFDDAGDRRRETWELDFKIHPTEIRRVGFRVNLDFAEGEWRARKLRVRYKLEGDDETHILYEKEGKENFKLLEDDGDEWWDNVQVQLAQHPDETEARLRQRVESDKCCAERLVSHLNCHKVYYWNAIWFLEDPNERLYRFRTTDTEAEPFRSVRLWNSIENRPVGALGDMIAFPEVGSKPEPPTDDAGNPIDPIEQCVALPTHGVFAEAELGHCNSCEQKDITRFWDWSESPCPEKAPEIAPIASGSRAHEPNLQPSTMPTPIVNIVNPPAAPDPTGLAAAMTLLATPNIFRDMSGLQEVSALLQKLAEGSISLAEARVKARGIQERQGGNGGLEGLPPNEQHDQNMVTRSSPELTEEEQTERVRRTVQPRRPRPTQEDEEEETQSTPPDLRTVEIRLRAFVPYEIWEPSLGLPLGAANLALAAIRFNGDNRDFSADQGTSRVDLPVLVRLDANDMSIVETNLDRGLFSEAEVYWGMDIPPLIPVIESATENIEGEPEWAERKKPGAQPITGMTGRLEPTPQNVSATAQRQGQGVLVRLKVAAQPYFPFTEEALRFVPNIEYLGASLHDVLRDLIHAALPDIDADIRITISKRGDGELEFEVSGEHDGFPAWELYVNGDQAYAYTPIDDPAPESLLAPMDTRVVLSAAALRRIE